MPYTEQKRESIVEKSIGQIFGKMTVLCFAEFRSTPKGSRVPMVKCRCDCGKEKIVSIWDLRQGRTRSCGLNHPKYEDRSKPAFNSLYRNVYKARAIKSGLKFLLTEKVFRELTQQECHYCGKKPSTCHKRASGNRISEYVYNGIDRKDNSIGYIAGNVLPCCSICNHAKHTLRYDVFTDWLDTITHFRYPSEDKRPE